MMGGVGGEGDVECLSAGQGGREGWYGDMVARKYEYKRVKE